MEKANLSRETQGLLRCPATRQKLHPASAEELKKLGVDFAEGGFLTEDKSMAYPIENGLPVLKAEDGKTIKSR
ncbi:MAG: hypothetical protein MI807_00560 [Verrucomicrobiales bacterium]|nr:hypothetical protein [Verrucomicrobiales bacterium]